MNTSREPVYDAVVLLARGLLRALDVTVRIEGADEIPATGPVLMAATHVSYPDFAFVQAGARQRGRRTQFMCRHDIWHASVVGRAMDAMGHIPVDRSVPAAAYLRARSLLAAGESVCAFPEAGISYSYAVRSLMNGVASLSRDLDIPVIPVAIWGSQRLYSVGRPDAVGKEPPPDLTRGRLVDVRFGSPVRAVDPGADLSEWTTGLGHRLTTMLEDLQRLPEHRPRPGEYAPWYPAHLGGDAPTRAEAAAYDFVPRSAVPPTWGPPPHGPIPGQPYAPSTP